MANNAMSQEVQRKQVLAKLLETESGRKKLASSYSRLFRKHRDYVGLLRKFLRVDPLAQGVPSTYDIDPEFGAYTYDEAGESVLQHITVSRVTVPIFTLRVAIEESLADSLEARFHVPDRIRDKGRAEVVRLEDTHGLTLIDAASTYLGQYTPGSLTPSPSQISPEAIISAMAEIEKENLIVRNSVWHPYAMTWFRGLGREWIDPVNQQELMNTGLMLRFQGMNVFRSVQVPTSVSGGNTYASGYIMTEGEYLGRIPYRKDITVIPMDSTRRLTIGYNIFEMLGISVLNPKGSVKLDYQVIQFTA